MDPIAKALDKTEELIGHSPHPAIVALPLGAWAVSSVCDGLAMLTGEDKYDDAARLSMVVGLVGAAGAAVTGLNDYAKIPKERPSHEVATTHALGNAAVVTLMTASYVMRASDHAQGRPSSLASRLLGLAGSGLSLYTGWLGGKLVSEMGESVYPAMEQMTREESEPGSVEDDAHGRDRLDPAAPLGLARE